MVRRWEGKHELQRDRFPRCKDIQSQSFNRFHLFLECLSKIVRGRFVILLPDSAMSCPMVVNLCCHPESPLRLWAVWQFPRQVVWPDVISSGVVVLMGSNKTDGDLPYLMAKDLRLPPSTKEQYQMVRPSAALRWMHLSPPVLLQCLRGSLSTYGDVMREAGVEWQRGPHMYKQTLIREFQPEGVWKPPVTHPVRVEKGSVFHARYVCDTFPCFPKKYLALNRVLPSVSKRDTYAPSDWHEWSSIARMLVEPNRPEVLVVPLFIDRTDGHTERLRACRLPHGLTVDRVVHVHSCVTAVTIGRCCCSRIPYTLPSCWDFGTPVS